MVMATCGTFDYRFVVPEGPASGTRRMPGGLREPIDHDPERLLGHAPLLETVEYQREPWQLYSRITLSATDKQYAIARAFAFSVDRELIAMLRPEDVLFISRTHCAGLGLSVLRGGELVAAAGAVIHVPLGPTVSVRSPMELIDQAEAIFRARDPEYRMGNQPVELCVGDVRRILHGGRPTIGGFEILVRHGFLRGLPGTNECISIERLKMCPSTAAHNSAQLMEEGDDGPRLDA